MDFNDYSFHDATIVSVTEHSATQTVDFLIDYPTDWTNNVFEHRILSFTPVTYYLIKEIPFVGPPTILDIEYKSTQANDSFGNPVTTVIISTNAGMRELQYKHAQLLTLD